MRTVRYDSDDPDQLDWWLRDVIDEGESIEIITNTRAAVLLPWHEYMRLVNGAQVIRMAPTVEGNSGSTMETP